MNLWITFISQLAVFKYWYLHARTLKPLIDFNMNEMHNNWYIYPFQSLSAFNYFRRYFTFKLIIFVNKLNIYIYIHSSIIIHVYSPYYLMCPVWLIVIHLIIIINVSYWRYNVSNISFGCSFFGQWPNKPSLFHYILYGNLILTDLSPPGN